MYRPGMDYRYWQVPAVYCWYVSIDEIWPMHMWVYPRIYPPPTSSAVAAKFVTFTSWARSGLVGWVDAKLLFA